MSSWKHITATTPRPQKIPRRIVTRLMVRRIVGVLLVCCTVFLVGALLDSNSHAFLGTASAALGGTTESATSDDISGALMAKGLERWIALCEGQNTQNFGSISAQASGSNAGQAGPSSPSTGVAMQLKTHDAIATQASTTGLNPRYWTDALDSPGLLDMSEVDLEVDAQTTDLLIAIGFYPPFYGFDVGAGGDGVLFAIDSDSNANTGNPMGSLGVDYVISFQYASGSWSAAIARTPTANQATWGMVRVVPAASVPLSNGGTALGCYVSRADIGRPTTMSFMVASLYYYSQYADPYLDQVPDYPQHGVYSFPTSTPTTLPPVTTTTTLPPTTTTTVPPTTTTTSSTTPTTSPSSTTTTLPQGPQFSDVSSSHPYSAQIADLAYRGIIGGFPNGTFQPDASVTRQQFAKMIVKTLDLPVSESDTCPFIDVPTNLASTDPLYPDHYVAVCAARGITVGKTATNFAPFASISRAQLITMVSRSVGLPDPNPDYAPPFAPFDTTHYPFARRAAFAGVLNGLQGMGPDFAFFDAATRGEVCVVLYNLLHR